MNARQFVRMAMLGVVVGVVTIDLHAMQQRPALADWNGLIWGMSASAAEVTLGQPLKPAGGTESADRLAADNYQVDGYNARVVLTFLRDRLAGILVTYDDVPFDAALASLSSIHGEPLSTVRPPQTGSRPIVRKATWAFSNAAITLMSVYTPAIGNYAERTSTGIEISPR